MQKSAFNEHHWVCAAHNRESEIRVLGMARQRQVGRLPEQLAVVCQDLPCGITKKGELWNFKLQDGINNTTMANGQSSMEMAPLRLTQRCPS